ncbi:MAG: hypothetical protein HC934_04715 [Acaryochloridaceae cyanobacterium SU_2_1]|nr:hypothetical protein [Acaryochloridaceae cyanobacterium SU_2_1]
MKQSKTVELLLALGLSASLAACGGASTSGGEDGEQVSPSPAVTSPTPKSDKSGDDADKPKEDTKKDEGGEGGEGGEG